MLKFTVGLPAYNEEATVQNVAEIVSSGLLRSGVKRDEADIVLIDSDSNDSTVAEFEASRLDFPREVMIIKEGVRGKGINLMKFLGRAKSNNAENALMFDADLVSITPEWVERYISQLKNGTDYVTPAYSRNKYEGSATNHLVFPVVYASSGRFIRQPIGGDFALSNRLYEHVLQQKTHPDTLKYGIDAFFTTAAVFGGFNIAAEKLGKKIHKPSFPQLATMFPHIANALHMQLRQNKSQWNLNGESDELVADEIEDIAFFPHKEKANAMKIDALQTFKNGMVSNLFSKGVGAALKNGVLAQEDWVEILERFCIAEEIDESEMRVMTELYKIRVCTHWDAITLLSSVDVEKTLLKQAKNLRNNLSLYER
jgi:glucosylglycerate synthase